MRLLTRTYTCISRHLGAARFRRKRELENYILVQSSLNGLADDTAARLR